MCIRNLTKPGEDLTDSPSSADDERSAQGRMGTYRLDVQSLSEFVRIVRPVRYADAVPEFEKRRASNRKSL
jgi:hypothetical protein